MKILVINGPNLNFLGIREKKIYGTQDYQYLLDLIDKKAKETGEEIQVFQSNHEGAIIDNGGDRDQPRRLHPLQLCHPGCSGKRGYSQGGDSYFRYYEQRRVPQDFCDSTGM